MSRHKTFPPNSNLVPRPRVLITWELLLASRADEIRQGHAVRRSRGYSCISLQQEPRLYKHPPPRVKTPEMAGLEICSLSLSLTHTHPRTRALFRFQIAGGFRSSILLNGHPLEARTPVYPAPQPPLTTTLRQPKEVLLSSPSGSTQTTGGSAPRHQRPPRNL